MKITKTQILTLNCSAAFAYYEWVVLPDWAVGSFGPLFRMDLLVIYPVLALLAGISQRQLLRRR